MDNKAFPVFGWNTPHRLICVRPKGEAANKRFNVNWKCSKRSLIANGIAGLAAGVLAGASPVAVLAQSASPRQLDIGLIFVGASWCAQCHLAAPLIKLAAATHNLPLIVASRDDRPIPPFETFIPASTHALAAQIKAFPALLIWSPRDQAIIARIDGIRTPRLYLARLSATFAQLREAGYVR